jgi:hypothetical protein
MTDQEIARALETLIREDGKRPPQEQIRDLIEAGVIDEQGRVLIDGWDKTKENQKDTPPNAPSDAPSARKAAGT